jgi:hypothetical protein
MSAFSLPHANSFFILRLLQDHTLCAASENTFVVVCITFRPASAERLTGKSSCSAFPDRNLRHR